MPFPQVSKNTQTLRLFQHKYNEATKYDNSLFEAHISVYKYSICFFIKIFCAIRHIVILNETSKKKTVWSDANYSSEKMTLETLGDKSLYRQTVDKLPEISEASLEKLILMDHLYPVTKRFLDFIPETCRTCPVLVAHCGQTTYYDLRHLFLLFFFFLNVSYSVSIKRYYFKASTKAVPRHYIREHLGGNTHPLQNLNQGMNMKCSAQISIL